MAEQRQSGERRVAIYGGSFDPVHHGHLTIARRLIELFDFESVWLMPAYVAPHKRGARVTPALHRYAMLALATQNDARVSISRVELDAPERPYTVDTLSRLVERDEREGGPRTRFFFVMGADSWAEIATWREWEKLLSMVDHVVVTRPGSVIGAGHVTAQIQERIADLRGAGAGEFSRAAREGRHIYLTDAVMIDASSTRIRRAAGENDFAAVSAATAPSVAAYIEKYGLYRDEREA